MNVAPAVQHITYEVSKAASQGRYTKISEADGEPSRLPVTKKGPSNGTPNDRNMTQSILTSSPLKSFRNTSVDEDVLQAMKDD